MLDITVFIDEAGTLPDPKDKVIVLAAVATRDLAKMRQLIKRSRRVGSLRGSTGEFKFYTAGEKTKKSFFSKLNAEKIDIFVLIVEKQGRKIPDSPRHYAILCWLLLTDIYKFYISIDKVIFDKHFHREKDIRDFNKIFNKLLRQTPQFTHVDSKNHQLVNVADMVAGAVLAKECGKSDQHYKMVAGKILSETRVSWPEAKRRIINKIA
ncbi:MAG: DUF3800 domain-containing protein [bacterium]